MGVCASENLNRHARLYGLIFLVTLIHCSVAFAAKWQPDIKTVIVNNYAMSYVERGHGNPLVLVHGVLSDYRTWLPLMKELSETSRVIAVSLRHFYPEHWNGKDDDFSLQQHADDLAMFIKTLKLEPADLLGHSRGGAVALLTASQNPKLIRHLILAEPAPFTSLLVNEPSAQKQLAHRKAVLKKMLQEFHKGKTDAALEVFIDYVVRPATWQHTIEERRNRVRANAWTITGLLNDMEFPFNCSDAAKITSPTLYISGDRKHPLYRNMYAALKACIPHLSKAEIGSAGHQMFQANPTAFVFEVQEFVAP